MKNIIKIAGFVAGVIIIIGLLGFPFRGGYWYLRGYLADRDCRIAGIQEEPEGQIDVLNVGDSLADIAITPVEMYRDYGITSYVMGRDLQKCIETYYAIKLALRTQPVKVVLWETHNLSKHQGGFDPYIIGVSEYAKYRSQFIKYHYVWKRWMEGKGIRNYFKGYVVNEAVTPYEGDMPYMNTDDTEVFKIPDDQMYVFKKIYKFCQKEGIKIVLYSVPSPHCYDMRQHNAYAKLDLNLFGTRKMTRYLGDYLRDNCDLTDHREDPAYQSWADQLAAYEKEVKDMEGTSYPKIEEEIKKSKQHMPDDSDGSGTKGRK